MDDRRVGMLAAVDREMAGIRELMSNFPSLAFDDSTAGKLLKDGARLVALDLISVAQMDPTNERASARLRAWDIWTRD